MREVLTIQAGQCGNQLGSDFWEMIASEHEIASSRGGGAAGSSSNITDIRSQQLARRQYRLQQRQQQKEAIEERGGDDHQLHHHLPLKEEHFQPVPIPSRLIPRAILVDTEPGTLQGIQSSNIGKLFSPDNIIYGHSGTGNNWAKGHYSEGKELLDRILDSIRHEIELCDHLQVVQWIHSLGGGTGSGLGTLLIEAIQEEYPSILLSTYSVIPSPKVSDTVVEPYNTVLAMNVLIDRIDQVFTFDNEALYQLAMTLAGDRGGVGGGSSTRGSMHTTPSYSDLNYLVAQAMSGTTSTIRYPGTLNCDYRKLAVNLVPFPRLHFYMVSQAPLLMKHSMLFSSLSPASPTPLHPPMASPLPSMPATRPATIRESRSSPSQQQQHHHDEATSHHNYHQLHHHIRPDSPDPFSSAVEDDFQHHHHHTTTTATGTHASSSDIDLYRTFDIKDISNQLFDAKNFMSAVDPRYGKYLTCGCLFRSYSNTSREAEGGEGRNKGDLSLIAIQDAMAQLTNRNSSLFTEWIPNHVTVALSHTPMIPSHTMNTTSKCSSTLVANNTAIQEIWKRILLQYSAMYRRKAFVHWYTNEGMEEQEFIESEQNMRDLISEYQQYQDMTADLEEGVGIGEDVL